MDQPMQRMRPLGGARAPVPADFGDGMPWSPEEDRQLNEAFKAVFDSPAGALVIDYLETITIRSVLPPSMSSDALRHRMGMCDLLRVIKARKEAGAHPSPHAG